MATYNQQYRPLINETSRESDPLCTCYYRDGRRNANVLKGSAVARAVLATSNFPVDSLPHGGAGALAETFALQTRIPARSGYSSYSLRFWGYNTAASTANGIVRFRTDARPYTGDGTNGNFDTSVLSDAAQSASLTVTGTGSVNAAWYESTATIVPDRDSWCWLIMTVELPVNCTGVTFGILTGDYKVLS